MISSDIISKGNTVSKDSIASTVMQTMTAITSTTATVVITVAAAMVMQAPASKTGTGTTSKARAMPAATTAHTATGRIAIMVITAGLTTEVPTTVSKASRASVDSTAAAMKVAVTAATRTELMATANPTSAAATARLVVMVVMAEAATITIMNQVTAIPAVIMEAISARATAAIGVTKTGVKSAVGGRKPAMKFHHGLVMKMRSAAAAATKLPAASTKVKVPATTAAPTSAYWRMLVTASAKILL